MTVWDEKIGCRCSKCIFYVIFRHISNPEEDVKCNLPFVHFILFIIYATNAELILIKFNVDFN